MASGCGCKEVYRFPLLLIPTPLVSAPFCSSIQTFFVLVPVLFCNLS